MRIYSKLFIFAAAIFTVVIAENIFPQQGGYVNRFSHFRGDTLKFYISTSTDPFNFSIYKIENEEKLVTQITGVKGGVQVVKDSSYYYGCRWNVTLSYVIPQSWKPGVYRAVFPTNRGTAGILFYILEDQPGTYSRILFVMSTNTENAYNNYGGKSSYDFNSTNLIPSFKVSFLRPGINAYGSFDFFQYERRVVNWMARNNIFPEYITDTELDRPDNLLMNYDVVVVAGHSEYWTRYHRRHFDNYLNSGGKIIFLAGASCLAQVRMEGDKMVLYKPSTDDPMYGVVDSLVTASFGGPVHNWPENTLTGVCVAFGGYVNHNGTLDYSQGFGDYAAYNTHHWAFENTFLKEGQEYGHIDEIVGNEVDAADFIWKDGIPVVTGERSTPLNYRILSLSPASGVRPDLPRQQWATMGMFYHPSGGAVFNTTTIRWGWGLDANETVQQITKNVFDKFINNNFPPDIVSWSPLTEDSLIINTKMHHRNKRDFLYKENSLNQTFSVNAEDPHGESESYFWTEDGVLTGSTSSLNVNKEIYSGNTKKFTVKAYVYNSKDTSTIKWNYFNSELAFASDPVTHVKPGANYLYNIEVFNYYNDKLTYEVTGKPSWLFLDSEHKLRGKAPSQPDTFNITLKVTNTHNQTDTQEFDLVVTDNISHVPGILPPLSYSLEQNYPNPFNPTTKITYSLPGSHSGRVTLKVYDITGTEVAALVDENQNYGIYSVNFSSQNLASGVYFYTLITPGYHATKKLVVMK